MNEEPEDETTSPEVCSHGVSYDMDCNDCDLAAALYEDEAR